MNVNKLLLFVFVALIAFLCAMGIKELIIWQIEGHVSRGIVVERKHYEQYYYTTYVNNTVILNYSPESWSVVVKGERDISHRIDTETYYVSCDKFNSTYIGKIWP